MPYNRYRTLSQHTTQKVIKMEPQTKAVRTGLRDLKRQLTFRETMLARRKQRYAEDISAAEWAIQNLKAKIAAETEQKEAH